MNFKKVLLTTWLIHFLCSNFAGGIGLKAKERHSIKLSPKAIETAGDSTSSEIPAATTIISNSNLTTTASTTSTTEPPTTTTSTTEATISTSSTTAATATGLPASDSVTSDNKKPVKKKLVCLYGAFAAYRDGLGQFTTDKIDPFLCTHIIHGSFGLSENYTIESPHPHIDFDQDYGFGLLKKLAALKQINPDLKTLISLGGSEITSGEFSSLAQSSELRKQFVASVVQFLANHRLDGVDINWQFPGAFTGDAEVDKVAFVDLLSDLKAALGPHNYLLSAQVAAAYTLIKMGYDIPALTKPLDLVLLMAYDYHELRENKTGLIAPLYGPKHDPFDRDNVNWSVKHWLKWGAPADKLILGLTSYAFTFTLNSASFSEIGAPVDGPGEEGPYTKMPGLWGYNEVCEVFGKERGWKKVIDGDLKAVYAVNGRRWVSYECRKSLELKTRYALANKLAGIGFYSLDTDDFVGHCYNATFPLARRIKQVIQRRESRNNPVPFAETEEKQSLPLENEENLANNYLLTFDD